MITNDDTSYLGNHGSSLNVFLADDVPGNQYRLLFRRYSLSGPKIVLTDRKVDKIQEILKIRGSISLSKGTWQQGGFSGVFAYIGSA
jgi:hypothetical protein